MLTMACASVKRPPFFEARRGSQVVHVLGTIHIGIAASELPDFVLHRFRAAPIFACEVTDEFSPTTNFESFEVDVIRRNMRENRRLSQRIRPEAWRKFLSLQAGQVPPEKVDFFPARLALRYFNGLASGNFQVTRAEYQKLNRSMDRELFFDAQRGQKKLMRLDTDDVMTDVCYARMFEAAVLSYEPDDASRLTKSLERIDVLVERYKSGIEEESTYSRDITPEIRRCALEDRNFRWAQLLSASRDTHVFAAVGAGHLFGTENLLEFLRQRGFQVTRIER